MVRAAGAGAGSDDDVHMIRPAVHRIQCPTTLQVIIDTNPTGQRGGRLLRRLCCGRCRATLACASG
jgi:hypothetical protein